MPIDLPFTDLNKIIAGADWSERPFPRTARVRSRSRSRAATIVAAGERLLISLGVHGKEKTSFLGFGADATVQIWGRPVLDQAQQTLRLTDVELAVESEAAFGLLGAAARAAVPHLQRALLQKVTVDLKPFASNAREKIAEAIADLQKNEDGVKVAGRYQQPTARRHRLDAKTLRVIAEAQGSISATISKVPEL